MLMCNPIMVRVRAWIKMGAHDASKFAKALCKSQEAAKGRLRDGENRLPGAFEQTGQTPQRGFEFNNISRSA